MGEGTCCMIHGATDLPLSASGEGIGSATASHNGDVDDAHFVGGERKVRYNTLGRRLLRHA
jgi:hypothetical protein